MEITALAGAFTNIKNTLSRVDSARQTAEAQLAALKAERSQDQVTLLKRKHASLSEHPFRLWT